MGYELARSSFIVTVRRLWCVFNKWYRYGKFHLMSVSLQFYWLYICDAATTSLSFTQYFILVHELQLYNKFMYLIRFLNLFYSLYCSSLLFPRILFTSVQPTANMYVRSLYAAKNPNLFHNDRLAVTHAHTIGIEAQLLCTSSNLNRG